MEAKDKGFYSKKTLNINGELYDLETPKVMGILNLTPDSFYDGGKHNTLRQALLKVEAMLAEGADLIDIGAYSSRPGAANISPDKEIARLTPALKEIKKQFPKAILSIDTFRAEVAKSAVEEGAHIINDISGGNLDHQMFSTVASLKVPYILMHMRGTPETMSNLTHYENLTRDVVQELAKKVLLLKQMQVNDIIIDPGYGFAKTLDQNYELLKNLEYFHVLEYPLLVGISRKSMIYKKLEISPEEALNGTTALNMFALSNGASILRVHDVKEAVETVRLFNTINA